MTENKIDWYIVKGWVENHWFERDPPVSDDEIDTFSIGVAGEVDRYVKSLNEEIKKLKGIVFDLSNETGIFKILKDKMFEIILKEKVEK